MSLSIRLITKLVFVLSKYSDNLSYGRPDNNVGPIYQDIDVTPGSELQFHFIGTSMGNISGFNSARLFVYDANNPSTLLYKGTPKTSSQPFGILKGYLMYLIISQELEYNLNH